MSNEWKDLPDLQWVATAQAEEWEIDELYKGERGVWDGAIWRKESNYFGRPKQPKMKTITLRKALLITFNGKHYACDIDFYDHERDRFVCWLGEPYTVEVPA